MSCEERNRISFYVACIGAFAERFSVSNAFAYNYLSQYKGLDFIFDFYGPSTKPMNRPVSRLADYLSIAGRQSAKLPARMLFGASTA